MNSEDLDFLLGEFKNFKTLLKSKDDAYQNLLDKLLHLKKQNKVLEEGQATFLAEITELNCTVTQLQNSFAKLDDQEAERKSLVEENNKLKAQLKEQKELFVCKVKENEDSIHNFIAQHNRKLEDVKNQAKEQVNEKLQNFKSELEGKEKEIISLKEQFDKCKKDKEEYILKIQVEHAEKLEKIKNQAPKNRVAFQQNLKNNDIFRQKYMQLEKTHNSEVSQLKDQILKLQLLNKELTSKNYSSLNCPIQKLVPKETAKENFESYGSRNPLTPMIKKVKITENWNFNTWKLSNVNNQNATFKQSPSTTISELADKPKRRKLFNPNIDYQKKK